MAFRSDKQRKAAMARMYGSIPRGTRVRTRDLGVIGTYEGLGKRGHVIRTNKNVVVITKKQPMPYPVRKRR